MPVKWKSRASASGREERRKLDLAAMLSPENVRCAAAGSKKHALDLLSEMLADSGGGVSAAEVLEELSSRERLGSTGLGRSAALPHAKMAGLERGAAAFLKLEEPVDFDSPDGEPVDLLLGVLLPGGSTEEQDAREIGELAQRLAERSLQEQLRGTEDRSSLWRLLVNGAGHSCAS